MYFKTFLFVLGLFLLENNFWVLCETGKEGNSNILIQNKENKSNTLPQEYSGPAVEWKILKSSDVVASLKELIPAGIQHGPLKQYICRVFSYYKWIPGKLVFNHSSIGLSCDIGIAYEEVRVPVEEIDNIEVLVAAPESISWVPVINFTVPDNFVNGGSLGDVTPLCRHSESIRYVYVGKYDVEHNRCWFTRDGREESENHHIEVLVVNFLGVTL